MGISFFRSLEGSRGVGEWERERSGIRGAESV